MGSHQNAELEKGHSQAGVETIPVERSGVVAGTHVAEVAARIVAGHTAGSMPAEGSSARLAGRSNAVEVLHKVVNLQGPRETLSFISQELDAYSRIQRDCGL